MKKKTKGSNWNEDKDLDAGTVAEEKSADSDDGLLDDDLIEVDDEKDEEDESLE